MNNLLPVKKCLPMVLEKWNKKRKLYSKNKNAQNNVDLICLNFRQRLHARSRGIQTWKFKLWKSNLGIQTYYSHRLLFLRSYLYVHRTSSEIAITLDNSILSLWPCS